MEMFGLLNIDKPIGQTSRRVVDGLKRLVRPAKVGHTGTLDPLAGGVLVLCVGPATRLAEYVQRMPKRYQATFLLGRRSDSEDVELPVTVLANSPRPTLDDLRRATRQLTGRIAQRPPVYSAVKIHGRRAYQLARRGDPVALVPRPVVVHAIRVTRYDYPAVELDIECGGGTYIRSLGRDLAESLGTAAVMSALTRTAVGRFSLADACRPESLRRDNLPAFLLPPLAAVAALPQVQLTEEQCVAVTHGRSFALADEVSETGVELAAVDGAGRLIAILKRKQPGIFRANRSFPPGGTTALNGSGHGT